MWFSKQPKASFGFVAVVWLSKHLGKLLGQTATLLAMKLLLVEDNEAMQATLQRTLERQGFHVSTCSDGTKALNRWQATQPDVVLLDLSLPGMDGLQVLAAARAAGLTTPVMILTARSTVGDRILGLNTGADDYLAKPFDLDELEARVRALHRRSASTTAPPEVHAITHAGLRGDWQQGVVYQGDLPLDLSAREAAMLLALMAKRGQAVAKERLFAQVFKDDADVNPDAIEVVAYRLRKKLVRTNAQLVTLRGLGYLLKDVA
jgi:two-component system, OmpR family, response regulator TctD